jgi:phosphinothricin acetyltransferase
MTTTIRNLTPDDWPAIRSIYEEGIQTRLATFETECPDWRTWNAAHRSSCRLVAESGDRISGWAALSTISERCVYAGVAEVSVYVGRDHRGQGVGTRLLKALIEASENEGIWTLQAGIFPDNETSIRLHERFGFRHVGRRERLGQLAGVWMDVLLLERRSQRVGI